MAFPRFIERVVAQITDRHETWPPREMRDHWQQIEEYRRRYKNDRSDMIAHNPNISIDAHLTETFVPVPWPRELCRFSAALLFSETPRVTRVSAREKVDTLERVNDFGAFAIRGGIKVASEGRIGIRVIRDHDINLTVPLLTLVPEDKVIWDERHDHFYAGGIVVIERRPDLDDRSIVFRLLEEHTIGMVRRTLFKGSENSIGKEVSMSTLAEFEGLAEEERTGLDAPTLIPWENVPGGESDLFGLGPLFDDINESETLFLDKARKSIPRVFVDRSLADESGRISIDGYNLVGGSRMRPALGTSPGDLINTVQPRFDAEEHMQWSDHLTQTMVTLAGYSPMTWGIQGQTANVTRAVSGYAIKLAQLRTLLTRSQKQHMALQALGWGIATALTWMGDPGSVADSLPTIELGDGLPPDPLDGAQEVLFLRQAMAASTETLVQTIHPTWTPEEIEAEVKEITASMVPPGVVAGQGGVPLTPRMKAMFADADRFAAGDGVDREAEPVGG